ncbi:TonB-dependent receptor family protein [Rheinheimera fenheensis]|uniref:TonB-dependent receptor family protein n=1 Tax=Rheinheimera fenheensis TaxID=3152295 RepID=UPI00325EA4FA
MTGKITSAATMLSTLALAFSYSNPVFSQQSNPQASDTADNAEVIVVSASLQREAWLNSPASTALSFTPDSGILIDSAQLFAGLSGVQADSRANFAQDTRLSVRGFGSRSAFGIRSLYLQQDGIPISTPDGQGQLSSILLDNIESVEVLKGPLAALYGNASGGVISLYSRTPVQNAVGASVAGSEQHRQYQLFANWVSGESSLSASAKRFTTDGYRPHSQAEKQQAQLLYRTALVGYARLSARLDYARDPQLQDPLGLSLNAWRANPQQTDEAALRFDTEKNSKQRQLSVSLSDYPQDDAWQISAWLGERQIGQRLAFPGSAPTSAGGEVVLDRQFSGVNAHYRLLQGETYQLRVGASIMQSDDDRLGFINDFGQRGELRRDQTDSANSSDMFIRGQWQPAQRWQLQAGWRYSELKLNIADRYINADNPDDSGSKAFYNQALAAGVNYQINDNLSAFLSAARGFESPTLAEIAYKADDDGINLTLNASRNRQWETGLKWQHHNITGSVSLFDIQTTDELVVDQAVGGRTSYRNAAQTARNGAELQLSWRHNGYVRQQLGAHYLSAEFDAGDLSGKRLPGVAKQLLDWQLELTPWQNNTVFSLQSRYRSKVYTDDTNSAAAPAAVTFSLAARHSQQLQQLTLDYWLALDNLTDKTYVGSVIVNNGRPIEPAPGRELSAGVSARFYW